MHDHEIFHFGDLWINFVNGRAKGSSGEFYLTAKEALLMRLLVVQKNSIVSREELLEKVWGYDPQTETRTVDNFVARLRKYFEKKPQAPRYIITHREKGYEFKS